MDGPGLLARLAQLVAATENDGSLAARLCRACVELLGSDGGALTVAYTQPEQLMMCATDDVSARLEDLQDVLGEGPGPEAYRTGRMAVADLSDGNAGRWPMFTDAARRAAGSVVVYALPMRPGAEVLGILTMYQHSRQLPDPEEAELLSDAVGAALLTDPGSYDDFISGPWSTRAEVHQATGMVVAQLGISPVDALALLRAHAYASDAALADVAKQVVQRRLDFSERYRGDGSDES